MRRAVRWTKRAQWRLDEIGAYIARDNPRAAVRIIAAIAISIQRLSASPGRGRLGRVVGTRELIVTGTPYIVAYRVRDNDIEILTIQHGAQLWPDEL